MLLLLLRFFLSPVLPPPVPPQGAASEFISPPELGGLVRLLGIYPTARCFAVFDFSLSLPPSGLSVKSLRGVWGLFHGLSTPDLATSSPNSWQFWAKSG